MDLARYLRRPVDVPLWWLGAVAMGAVSNLILAGMVLHGSGL